ncbi:glucose-6-phosphate isomerase [Corynebacterium sp. 321]|uniref:glucose-6-phosphate isomerase n=1 Tax=Corynebacterium sp. 321 TaxID=2651047 RepID=UPI00130186F2|nr:glucose-6-phosphate isomerase [Corynebacterium sp. 321]KAB1551475.1 glucose-6-phosphate isomerase [Corynebacterium sp. 321]
MSHQHFVPLAEQDLTTLYEWEKLLEHAERFTTSLGTPTAVDTDNTLNLRKLFQEQPGRASDMTFQCGPLRVDLSKNLIDPSGLNLLVNLARSKKVEDYRVAMFEGQQINTTEQRSVLHTALRLPVDRDLTVEDAEGNTQDIAADVHQVLGRMRDFAKALRSGQWQGISGHTIKHVVNIGIGGSDLGPAMAAEALRPYQTAGITPHFISNVDPAHLEAVLDQLEQQGKIGAESTLFVVASKTFNTAETLANAHAARRWLLARLERTGVDVSTDEQIRQITAKHFVAVSTHQEEVEEFGIDPKNMFEFWDWVGGRYSVDSSIGLTLMAAIGPRDFTNFLEGFYDVDKHFSSEPLEMNVPVLMALLGVWYTSLLGAQSHAVLPYSQDLDRFPAYLQQLMMESNGKSVHLDGSAVTTPTGEIYWGEPGTNGQHAFMQLVHQGTHLIPVDFIGFVNPHVDHADATGAHSMHDMLMSNLFAQSRVLAFGKTAEELREEGLDEALIAHKVMPGNRPSTTILGDKLTPRTLGALIALYEHIAFVQGVLWGINSFDQWGVELGKAQATTLLDLLHGESAVDTGDSSTDDLIHHYRSRRER